MDRRESCMPFYDCCDADCPVDALFMGYPLGRFSGVGAGRLPNRRALCLHLRSREWVLNR